MRAAVKPGFLLMLAGGLLPPAAHAFAAEGHRVAGAIAERYLCAEARAYVAPLLDGSSLADAGVWADTIRDDPAWVHTRPWHYINVDDGESLVRALRNPEGNVLTAIDQAEQDVANRGLPREKRAEALRFLVHFIADVHQPLHVGRSRDRGGNELDVRWGEARMTLHEFWDARALLEAQGLGAADLAVAVGALAVGQERLWRAGASPDWAVESRALRPLIYDLPQSRGRIRLDDRYVAAARNVVSLRLAQAGVRVAERLNQIACPDYKIGQAVEPAGPTH